MIKEDKTLTPKSGQVVRNILNKHLHIGCKYENKENYRFEISKNGAA
jgi:hypothetical protein